MLPACSRVGLEELGHILHGESAVESGISAALLFSGLDPWLNVRLQDCLILCQYARKGLMTQSLVSVWVLVRR